MKLKVADNSELLGDILSYGSLAGAIEYISILFREQISLSPDLHCVELYEYFSSNQKSPNVRLWFLIFKTLLHQGNVFRLGTKLMYIFEASTILFISLKDIVDWKT